VALVTFQGPPSLEEVVARLARALSGEPDAAIGDRQRAEQLVEAAGIRALVDMLGIAERVLRAGEGFHSIERFFVEGSEEHRYLVDLHRRS
jgi:hypothetical protein